VADSHNIPTLVNATNASVRIPDGSSVELNSETSCIQDI
jgi:hypothetical protein